MDAVKAFNNEVSRAFVLYVNTSMRYIIQKMNFGKFIFILQVLRLFKKDVNLDHM